MPLLDLGSRKVGILAGAAAAAAGVVVFVGLESWTATGHAVAPAPIDSDWLWYEGDWRIEYDDAVLGEIRGWASIGDSSPRSDDRPRFVMLAVLDPKTGRLHASRGEATLLDGELRITVDSFGPSERVPADGVAVLDLPSDSFTVSVDGYAESGAVLDSMPPSATISITFPAPAEGAIESLEGEWRYSVKTRADMVRGRAGVFEEDSMQVSGEERWFRPPQEIVVALPLDPVHPAEMNELVAAIDNPAAAGLTGPARDGLEVVHRTMRGLYGDDTLGVFWLSLVGQDLPVQPRRRIEISIEDDSVVPTGALRSHPDFPQVLDVQVALRSGLNSSPKRLLLNEAETTWDPGLTSAPPIGAVFLRQATESEVESLTELRHGDVARLEVAYPFAPWAPSQAVLVVPRDSGGPATRLTLSRALGRPEIFRSPPVVVLAPGEAAPAADDVGLAGSTDLETRPPVVLRAPAGVTLGVGLADPAQADALAAGSEIASIEVVDEPPETLWEEALRSAVECRRRPESQREFTNYIFTNLVVPGESVAQTVEVSPEEHAAAILLRDELVRAQIEWIQSQNDLPAGVAAQRADAERFIDLAMRKADHAFFRMRVTSEEGQPDATFLGGAIYQPDYRIEQMKREGRWEAFLIYAQRAVAEARGRAILYAADALKRARQPTPCQLGELLEVVGVGLDPIVDRLLPRLMRPARAGEPRYPRWVPDTTARGYVNSLYTTAAAIAAQQRYSELDSDVVGLALDETYDAYAFGAATTAWARAKQDERFGMGILATSGPERLRHASEVRQERLVEAWLRGVALATLPLSRLASYPGAPLPSRTGGGAPTQPTDLSRLSMEELQAYHDRMSREIAEEINRIPGMKAEFGEDVLPMPEVRRFDPPSTWDELVALHVPGRTLSPTELERKAQAYVLREQARKAFQEGRAAGLPADELARLQRHVGDFENDLANAGVKGRAAAAQSTDDVLDIQLLDDRGNPVSEAQLRIEQEAGGELSRALDDWYTSRGKPYDRLHTLGEDRLAEIRSSGRLRLGGSNFSFGGNVGAVRRGGVAIRVKPEFLDQVHFRRSPTGESATWFPGGVPDGIEKVPTQDLQMLGGRGYLDNEILEYFDVRKGEWVDM